MNPTVAKVTRRVREKSIASRAAYLAQMQAARDEGPARTTLSCSNLAHGMAACGGGDKNILAGDKVPNIAIVSAYNDM
ncbi:MAG: phosphogluconate dehydratase, partial [Woeseia sp.]|nr:phosphogluconate dehydratase [Woeseia sp.]